MTDPRLKELHKLVGLTALDLADTQVTDKGLKELAGLKLTWLNLSNTQVTDAGLKDLQGLRKLARLELCKTGTTDAGLKGPALPR